MSTEITKLPQQITITKGNNLSELMARFEQGIGFDSPENIHDNFSALEQAKKFIRDIEKLAKTHTETYIKENKSFDIDGWVYKIGKEKKTKCIDVKATLAKLFEILSGDFDTVALCLGSNAWKHGQIKALLKELGKEDLFKEMFIVEEKEKLKREGPEDDSDSLLRINTNFIRKQIEDKDE